MANRIYAHRNLNAAKRDWSKWVYSYGQVKGNVGRGKVDGYTDDIVITNVTAKCQESALLAIYNGGYRSVSAWLIGTPTDNTPDTSHKLRKFSINPKAGELEFRWSDDKSLVKFPLPMVHLTPTGCYAVIA